MTTNERAEAPRSRRERPAKAALTRQSIIATALEILKSEDLERVTMRRVAAALDTGAASLYVYVKNTEDLHAQLLDALLASVSASMPLDGSWHGRLTAVLTNYMQVLFDYPGIARITMFTRPSGPNYFALLETILALLDEGGLPDREAAWAVDLLLQFATATAAEQSARKSSPQGVEESSALRVEVDTVDASSYPHIARLGDELLSGGPARFQWGLDVLVAGILTTHRTSAGEE